MLKICPETVDSKTLTHKEIPKIALFSSPLKNDSESVMVNSVEKESKYWEYACGNIEISVAQV